MRFETAIPELRLMMRPGDEKKDIYGKSIATVSKIAEIAEEPRVEIVIDDHTIGQKTLRTENKYAITAELLVTVTETNNGLVFNGRPLRVGSTFYFNTDLYEITGRVINLTTEVIPSAQ